MAMTNRDKWILATMPAIFAGAIYLWGFGRPLSRSITESREQALKAQEGLVAVSVLSAKQDALEDLQEKLSEAKTLSERLAKGNAVSGSASIEDRAGAAQKLSQILAAHQLSVQRMSRQAATQMPPQAEALWKSAESQARFPPPQFWRVELTGSYPDLASALQSVSKCDEFIVPVSIEMSPAEAGETLKWSLTVWL